MSAATRVRAMQPDVEVVVLEMSRFTSYSACGIPFVVGGVVAGGVEALVARSPDEHRRRGIDVRTHHEATGIDLDAGEVEFLDQHAGTFGRLGFDQLMIATGGEPVRPGLPGIDLPFIHGVQTLDDAQRLLALASEACRSVVIVGGGYIGLEMAEAYVERGCTATVVEKATAAARCRRRRLRCAGGRSDAVARHRRPMWRRRRRLRAGGGADVGGADRGRPRDPRHRRQGAVGDRRRGRHRAGRRAVPSSSTTGRRRASTVCGRPATAPPPPTSSPGSRSTSPSVRTPTSTAVSPASTWPAATPAAAQVLGTAITKLCSLEIALTGLRVTQALEAGFDAVATTLDATTVAGYLPDASPMTVRLVAERGTGRLLGAQIIGGPGAAKRIDTVATAITAGMTVADVADLDLAYAPPFSSVWDPVALAAREALKEV